MGEFILALHVFQNYFKSPTPMSYIKIKNALKGYLKQMVQDEFYMMTDTNAVESIESEINVNYFSIYNNRKVTSVLRSLLQG
jgi:hypothetical protein